MFVGAAFVAALCMLSCRTQKVATTDRSSEASYVDTTKTVADSACYIQTDTDTARISADVEDAGIIEFIEGGGKVSIDSTGNVVIEGVRNIRSRHRGNIAQEKGSARSIEQTAGRIKQLKGVSADQTSNEKRPMTRWQQAKMDFGGAAIGATVLAVCYLLFRIIRKIKS